jgi:adenosylmethionine-8-amino-7-oxononanoate aminotransferase
MDPKLIFPFTVNSLRDQIINFGSTYEWGYQKDNRKVIDLSLGFGSFPLGMSRSDFIKTVSNKMMDFTFIGGDHKTTNDAVLELSEKLYTLSGGYRSIFNMSGSIAVESAIKVGKYYQGNTRDLILGFENSYHGSTYLSSSISCTTYMHNIQGRESNCRTISWDLDETKEIIKSLGEDNISCVVVESCSWQAGLRPQSVEWWRELKNICSTNGILLIVDDIALCGAKTGKFFGFDDYIKPDIICAGKALTGGFYPLSDTLITEEIYQGIKDKWWGHGFTYGFNMSGVLSALHYQDVIEKESIYDKYTDVADTSTHLFNNYLQYESVKAVRNYGTYWCVDIDIKDQTDADILKLFFDNGLYLGIWNDPISKKQILIQTPNMKNDSYYQQLDEGLNLVFKNL